MELLHSSQGIWQVAERNCKLCGNLRAYYYTEDSVNYTDKIAINYVVVSEQMTRKNRSIMQKKY